MTGATRALSPRAIRFRRFRRHKLAVWSGVILAILIVLSLAAPVSSG